MNKQHQILNYINKGLQEIHSDLEIFRYSLYQQTDEIVAVSIQFPVKGNKPIIQRLESLGWQATGKRKIHNETRRRNQYVGFVMYQEMQLAIKEEEIDENFSARYKST